MASSFVAPTVCFSVYGAHTHTHTHTHSDPRIPLSFIMGIPGTCERSREAAQIPIPLRPVSPHSHGFLMGLKADETGEEVGEGKREKREEEKGRRAGLIHQ